MLTVPAALRALPDRDETWEPWLDALPRSVAGLLDDWALAPDGEPRHRHCALVLPVLTDAGAPATLKLAWPHAEVEHEHLALHHWHGDGAVRLLRADPQRWALLLERAHATDLTSVDDVEACGIAAGLLARLHRPAPPQLRRLSGEVATWTDRLAALPRSAPVPHRLVEQAVSLGRDLATDPATDGTLIHTDAHGENVLAADREPWLVIDPEPLSGDPAYEPAPMLWNRWPEVVASRDVRWSVRARLDAMVDALGLDPDRARDWAVHRALVQALRQLEDVERAGRVPDRHDHERLTILVAVAKAVQD
jgi:streptomycin 6-kinase